MKITNLYNALWLGLQRHRVSRNARNSVRRRRQSRFESIESLEDRTLLSGDTLTTAAYIDVYDSVEQNQAVEINGEIGDEIHGNLDVDLFFVGLAAGHTLNLDASVETGKEVTERLVVSLQSIIDANSGTKLAGAIEDAKGIVEDALDELNESTADHKGAIGKLKGAVSDLQGAVDSGLLDTEQGAELMNSAAGAARQLASEYLYGAILAGSRQKAVTEAQSDLDDGDTLRQSGDFKDAVAQYRKVVDSDLKSGGDNAKAGGFVLRVFDENGKEVARASGGSDVRLSFTAVTTGVYYVGISGNGNFKYDPNKACSGVPGSEGCFEMNMDVDDGFDPGPGADPCKLNLAPQITAFEVIEDGGGFWTFVGVVEDENPGALIIEFGGVLQGHTVQVNEDGTFSYTVELLQFEKGAVTAQTTDECGLESNVAVEVVIQPC